MNIEPLEPHHIRLFHEMALEEFDGLPGEHDKGMIDYTASKPFEYVPFSPTEEEVYPGLFLKAAVYMHSLATHQYFVDGNKRTAYITAASFLELNDYILHVSDEEMYFVAKLVSNSTSDIYNTGWDLQRIERWITQNCIPLNEYSDEMAGNKRTSPEIKKQYDLMEMVLFIHEKMKELRPSVEDIDRLELILSTATSSLFNKHTGRGFKLPSSLPGGSLNKSIPFYSPIENILFQNILSNNINSIRQKLSETYKPDEDLKGIYDIFQSLKPSKEQEYERHIMLIEALTLQINICKEKADYARAEELLAQQMELIKKLDNYNNE